MDAGYYKDRVQILQAVPPADPLRDPSGTWAVQRSVWANVKHQSGAQRISADKLHSKDRCSVRVRYNTCALGITAQNRLRIGTRDYTIVDTVPHGRDYIDLVCEAT